jgi:hypothetical protein
VMTPGLLLLVLGFACVWWPHMLLWMQYDDSTPLAATEGIVRTLGWVLLCLAVVVRVATAFKLGY